MPADTPLSTPAPSPDASEPGLAVSVKTLCAFAARAGDLDLRFAPAPSAQEGVAGHRLVQARRGAGYESEIALCARFGRLLVRGRADGFDPQRGRLEEIKTFRGELDSVRANHRALHWAQARCYAWMLCEARGLDEIEAALVYLDLGSDEESVLTEHWRRDDLRAHFEALCTRFVGWAEQEAAHCAARNAALPALAFPHAAFRPGQRDLAEAVYRVAVAGRCLLAQAPTGIGKTLATLFPLFKAWDRQRVDKLFFLTAKTSGRAIALDGLRRLAGEGTPLRVLELTAREKACEHPDKSCHGDSCPLAKGFYDRLPAARAEAAEAAWLDRAALRRIALSHEVCPYFLAQEMARWSDAIVGDYNYYFDGSAFLWALARDEGWRAAVLVDEAHNLLERARGMYSARLEEAVIGAVRRQAPPAIRKALARLRREWRRVQQTQTEDYRAHDTLPAGLARALQDTLAAMGDHFAAHPLEAQGPLQQCFFDLAHFARLADSFGAHSVFESLLGEDALAIRNLVPAPFLAPRFEDSLSTTCFSGTLAPFGFYRDTLGLPGTTATLDVGSPFRGEQLSVRIATDVSTRFRDRARSLDRVVRVIADQYAAQPGNYLAFFSSFDYLRSALEAFTQAHPEVPAWTQSRGMRESEREAFVARFSAGGRGIGFAVLGGPFGEGIDLPGDRLVGAFVASLGLPQHDAANECMRERMQAMFGDGYAYTYLYPGLQKVVQAAGRVIRSEQDAGVLYLLDDRFARSEIRALLPPWWQVQAVRASQPRAMRAIPFPSAA